MTTETTVIEINGVKLEVDLRHAKIIHENIKVGSKVKLLEKSDYNGPKVHPGVVIGFENFQTFPTIIVAYVKAGYGDGGLHMAYINSSKSSTDKWEMVPAYDDDLPVRKGDVLGFFEREITKKQAEVQDLEAKRDYFLSHFNAYFGELVQ